ncbi:MAG: SLC13/DASS family transporter [Reichenbachiella sp.]
MKLKANIIGLICGPLVFILIYFIVPFDGLSSEGRGVLACTTWLAIWWMTEAIPVEATALLPIILFPLTGSLDIKSTTFPYANPIIYLFLGGFIIAIAIEKCNLHRRIALNIIALIGTNPRRVILGFMIATGFLSMWISNTASTLMMVPIGLSVIAQLNSNKDFSKALLLAIAYSASIGGMATLIGTPPNIVFAGVIKSTFGVDVGFLDWMLIGIPFSMVLVVFTWLFLSRFAFKIDNHESEQVGFETGIKALGKMSLEEKRVLTVFLITAFCWVSRKFLLNPLVPALNDTIIAIAGAISLFLIPDSKGEKLIDWKQMNKLPWGVLMLFGGGLSIANAFVQTDLASWVGLQLNQLSTMDVLILILLIATFVNFLTELTSNVATASMILPILAALSISISLHPYFLMVAAILASSCAFMLPIATPPNAIVFGNDHIHMKDMVKTGLFINLLSILLITLFVYFLMPLVWELNLADFQLVKN